MRKKGRGIANMLVGYIGELPTRLNQTGHTIPSLLWSRYSTNYAVLCYTLSETSWQSYEIDKGQEINNQLEYNDMHDIYKWKNNNPHECSIDLLTSLVIPCENCSHYITNPRRKKRERKGGKVKDQHTLKVVKTKRIKSTYWQPLSQ